ncbi:translation initiation factor IF-2 [Candidatus Babeliales bacterium]|nr:translation initiation factor IF-2 [Candidatus Babeliales bacterium]MCF7899536.1 translation initiation factor IF-2 [Candidatus Babeliales bacterium]
MRIYEIAKEKNVPSKQIISLLKKAGIEVSSHMSVISKEGLAHIEKTFSPKQNVSEVSLKQSTDKEKKQQESMNIEKKVEPKLKKVITKSINTASKEKPKKDTFKKRFDRFHGHQQTPKAQEVITEIKIESPLPLFRVAEVMGKSAGDLIMNLLKQGMACNRNYILSTDIIKSLGNQFGINVIVKDKNLIKEAEKIIEKEEKTGHELTRWPIVVVMGHVDHGKTTLLDFIRKQNTAAKEKGGITQHLGAYQVSSNHGDIVFLDTPGHEAFSFLRSRGTKITDIAILVVAVDDGVKPQTIEAIKHAKASNVPIIVAANKIDKVESSAYLQTLKRQLAEQDLMVEDWGGDVVCVPISAKTGMGVNELLEIVVLQAQMMDLKADPKLPAKAFILESNIEKGYGPVATVICQDGSIKKGDFFVCGNATGKVRLLINSLGEKINQAGPSVPVKVVGFDSFAEIGDQLRVVNSREYFNFKNKKEARITTALASTQFQSLDFLDKSPKKQLNLIIKTDTRGSKEAIENSVIKLSNKMKKGYPEINLIQVGIGDISEKDVELSITTNSILLGLHVKVEKNAILFAKDKAVNIKLFDIIYKLIDYVIEQLEKDRETKIVYKKVAELVVRRVFNIKKIGTVAGCYVKEGVVSKGDKVVCVRNNKEIGEGKITSLQRETKTVKEVHAGFECGFVCEGFNDWLENDTVMVYGATKELVGETIK